MEPDQWSRVERLFHEVVELAPDDRNECLIRAGADTDVRREVESLVAAHTHDASCIRVAMGDAVGPLPDGNDEDITLIGAKIDRYTITNLIGSGGMGVVYKARREDDFRMEVAIKVLKQGTATPVAMKRFRAERQILAALQHPNIARLLDGGASQDGLPYFVMEYVDGTLLMEYAAALTIRERLQLFLYVCSAVQYAHQHQVIHRDLKPANIVVTHQGVPKLLDFGIAKLLDDSGENTRAELTVPGLAPMTPDYASPEQVRGQPITPATDVYLLGAVLYELLTGTRAQHPASLSASDIEEEICRHYPARPSAVAKGLNRDLDNIVMKAVHKEPAGRYASPEELAEDIGLFLLERPVHARSPSLLYRVRKFLARHRITVLAASMTGAAAAGLAGALAYLTAHRPPILTERDSIVIAEVSNRTGDPVFEDALRQALFLKLTESPYISALTDEQINRTLRLMGRKANERMNSQLGREICLRNGSKAVISGSITKIEQHYLLSLEATNCVTGGLLARTGEQVTGKQRVLPALGRAATELRQKLGESLSSVERFYKPVEATSSSLDALQAYMLARKARQEGRRGDQLAFLKRATELDPEFAIAFASLSAEYLNIRDTEKAFEYGRRAFGLRHRVTEREKFLLQDRYSGRSRVSLKNAFNRPGSGLGHTRAITWHMQASVRLTVRRAAWTRLWLQRWKCFGSIPKVWWRHGGMRLAIMPRSSAWMMPHVFTKKQSATTFHTLTCR